MEHFQGSIEFLYFLNCFRTRGVDRSLGLFFALLCRFFLHLSALPFVHEFLHVMKHVETVITTDVTKVEVGKQPSFAIRSSQGS